VNWVVAVLALITALDVPQRACLLRDTSRRERTVATGGLVLVAAGLAVAATPLLDALDISAPTMEVGAGLVLAVWSAGLLLRWDDERPPSAVAGGLVPLLFPILLTPVVGVTVLAVAARNGWWLPVLATAVGVAPVALPEAGRPLARRRWRQLSAAIGAVVGVVMTVDGALAV
jgi:small neutral amino acid transporter SnatA (MarC family)